MKVFFRNQYNLRESLLRTLFWLPKALMLAGLTVHPSVVIEQPEDYLAF